MPFETYKVITFHQKSLYITKNDELYVQTDMIKESLYSLKVDTNVTFKLGRTVRIYGTISRTTYSGFFIKNWSINNKGEKFAI